MIELQETTAVAQPIKEPIKEPTKLPPVFMDSGIITMAKRFLEETNLPKEALCSVVNTVRSHFGLEAMIEYQSKLHPDRRRNMVGVSPGFIITDVRLTEIDQFVQRNKFPYNSLYIAKDGSIAIRANGWRYRVQSDPRIFRGWEEKPVEIVKMDDGNILFRKWVAVLFYNGEKFPAEGATDMTEMQGRRQKTEAPPSFALMIAETRAQSRSLRSAIGLPFDIAEDVVAVEMTAIVPIRAPDVIPTEHMSTRMNVVSFLKRCADELHLGIPVIMSGLGIKNLGEISSYDDAYDKLKAIGNGPKGPQGNPSPAK